MLSKDQVGKIEKIHKTLAKLLERHYTILNSHATDVDIAFVDQTTYAEFIQSLPSPSHS